MENKKYFLLFQIYYENDYYVGAIFIYSFQNKNPKFKRNLL